MTDVTNSPDLHLGRSADVVTRFSMDRLLESVTPRFFLPAKNTEYQCLLCEWRLVRVWEKGSVQDNEQTLCFYTSD